MPSACLFFKGFAIVKIRVINPLQGRSQLRKAADPRERLRHIDGLHIFREVGLNRASEHEF